MKHIESTYFYISALELSILSQLSFYNEDILSLPHDVRAGTQDINWFLSFSDWSLGNRFVKISATCSLVKICSIWMVLFTSCDLKWCNLTDKCLIRANFLWLVAISMQLLLYSKTFHITVGSVLGIWKFCDWSSDSKLLIAITSISSAESAMYSASVVLSDIKGCILDDHTIGQP